MRIFCLCLTNVAIRSGYDPVLENGTSCRSRTCGAEFWRLCRRRGPTCWEKKSAAVSHAVSQGSWRVLLHRRVSDHSACRRQRFSVLTRWRGCGEGFGASGWMELWGALVLCCSYAGLYVFYVHIIFSYYGKKFRTSPSALRSRAAPPCPTVVHPLCPCQGSPQRLQGHVIRSSVEHVSLKSASQQRNRFGL